jgi:predicted transcriptional regulator
MLLVTLKEVQKAPGTVREIATRLNMEESQIAPELTILWSRGKVSRVKVPQPKGRPVYQYSVADEASSQA